MPARHPIHFCTSHSLTPHSLLLTSFLLRRFLAAAEIVAPADSGAEPDLGVFLVHARGSAGGLRDLGELVVVDHEVERWRDGQRPRREGQAQREVEVGKTALVKVGQLVRVAVVDFLSGAEAGQRTDGERQLGGVGNAV